MSLRLCSFAKCSKQIKHRCGEMSLVVPAALQSSGKLANSSLNDLFSSGSCWCSSSYHISDYVNFITITGRKDEAESRNCVYVS